MRRRSMSSSLEALEGDALDAACAGWFGAALAAGVKASFGRSSLAKPIKGAVAYDPLVHRQAQSRVAEAYASGDGRAIRRARRLLVRATEGMPSPSFW